MIDLSLFALVAVLAVAVPLPVYEFVFSKESRRGGESAAVLLGFMSTLIAVMAAAWFASALYYKPEQTFPLAALTYSSLSCGFIFAWSCLMRRISEKEDLYFQARREGDNAAAKRERVRRSRFFYTDEELAALGYLYKYGPYWLHSLVRGNTALADWKFSFLGLTKDVPHPKGDGWTDYVGLTEVGVEFVSWVLHDASESRWPQGEILMWADTLRKKVEADRDG